MTVLAGQRIANAAWRASEKGRPFTPNDVSGSMRGAIWLFEVEPTAPTPRIPALNAERTYIECQTTPTRIDPIREAFETVRRSNAFGRTFVGRRVNAYYNPSTLQRDHECRLFIVNDQSPRHCKIPADIWRQTF